MKGMGEGKKGERVYRKIYRKKYRKRQHYKKKR